MSRFFVRFLTIFAPALTTHEIVIAQNDSPSPNQQLVATELSPHFTKSTDCALCHSFSSRASAMRDSQDRNVAPFDLWSGSMMANSAVDPYWRAAVSAEVAATPAQKAHIEEVCSRCHAPMSTPIHTSPPGQVLAFLNKDHPKSTLGMDGVSCTVCHQIAADNLGTEDSFTGGFVINKNSLIYGPHANPVTMPMQRHVSYTPTKGDHILSSAMCATCHTVITDSYNLHGDATGVKLHEQVPYLEWRNSIFNTESNTNNKTARSCQSCHMPQSDIDGNKIATRLAHNPGGRDFPFLKPREPFGRHTFAGGNTFMTKLIRNHRKALGLATPTEAFDRVITESEKMLQQQTAQIEIDSDPNDSKHTNLTVKVKNLSGHKFPTAYPSRRAWIELVIQDASGAVHFASGRCNDQAQIIDHQGNVLSTERAQASAQPHYSIISDSSQVQIYESLMEDNNGELTFALLRGSRFQKDNRLLPLGWSQEHEHAEATRPQGISDDANFIAGQDSVTYQIDLPRGEYIVSVRLLFQSLSSRYMAELFQVDTVEVKAFKDLYMKSNLAPETISSAKLSFMVP